jgi:ribosomal protein S18 acetylase RimI-like enzyme
VIRPATPQDAAAAAALVDAAYGHYVARLGRKPGPMLDDHAARIAAGQAWVFEQDGAMAGWLVLIQHPDHLLLDNIAVAPALAGTGIGRALMRFTEVEAARRGHTELRLYTNALMAENIAMYTRAGWAETGRATVNGRDTVYFRKPVLASG